MKINFMKALSAVLVLSLTACGYSAAKEETASETAESEKTNETAKEEETVKNEKDAVTFETFTPIDNDECAVIVKELKEDSLWGYTVKLGLENKSADKTYMYAVESVTVNGVESAVLFATTVAPGKKSNDDLVITDASLKDNGINKFTDIAVSMRIYDSEDWAADPAAKETFHIYPYGEDKAEKFVRQPASTDIVLTDNDAVRCTVLGFKEDSIWGYTMQIYLENKTDSQLMYAINDASVNGYMADPFFAATVGPGCSRFSDVSWSDTTLEENGIDTVESIEFTLRVYNTDDWMNDYVNETFTVNP